MKHEHNLNQNFITATYHKEDNCIYRWFTKVETINRNEWDACFEKGDVLGSFDLARAIENSKLPDIEFHYLVGIQDNQLSFVIPCYVCTVPLDALAPSLIRRCFSEVRKYYSSFLVLRVLVVGNPLASCVGLERLNQTSRPKALAQIKEVLIEKGRSLKTNLIAFKEIEESEMQTMKAALGSQFLIVPSLPMSYLALRSRDGESYEARLRSRYRNLLRRRMKLLETAGIAWEVLEDFGDLAEILCNLYRQVYKRSKTKFEVLTPEFFKQLSHHLGKRSFILLAKKENRPMAFALFIAGDKMLYPFYIGLEYSLRDEFALYYNTLYRIIEESEKRNYERVWLGITAYESKAMLGASFYKRYLALCPLTSITSVILRAFRSLLFPSTIIPSFHVYKDHKI